MPAGKGLHIQTTEEETEAISTSTIPMPAELIRSAVTHLSDYRRNLDETIGALTTGLQAGNNAPATPKIQPTAMKFRAAAAKRKNRLTAAGRQRLIEAQRKRWAAAKRQKAQATSGRSIRGKAAAKPKVMTAGA
jgi:hypothetical protein